MEPLDETVHQPELVEQAVKAVTRTRHLELVIVVLACCAALTLIGATSYNTYKIKKISNANKNAQNFGLKAVECILDNLADHRWSNQVFHDNLGTFLHAPLTPHVPLPVVPSDAQFAADCQPFNLRIEAREGTKGPLVTTTTGVTK